MEKKKKKRRSVAWRLEGQICRTEGITWMDAELASPEVQAYTSVSSLIPIPGAEDF